MALRIRILLLALLLSVPSYAFAAKTHKVKKSETLATIAKKYRVSVTDLKNANNRLNSSVKSGDVLVIPQRATAARSSSEVSSGVASSYKVKKGDTLARVSKKTGVSVADLKRLNGLGKGKLKPGQFLALHDADNDAGKSYKVASRPSLRHADLLNDREYEQSLAELEEQDGVRLHQQKAPDFSADNVKLLKTKAFGFLGTRYRFGGSSRNGLDCSAFVQKVFNEMEVSLPRTAREQFEKGDVVTRGDMQKGDLVFFRTYASFPSHVGIYLGGNRMIHASSRDRRVVISSVDTPYYRSRFIGAKRVAKISPDRFNLDELMLGVEEEIPEEAPKNDILGVVGVEATN
jgi:LysM repeat protein